MSIHSAAGDVDLALPAGLPVAVLIPSIVDILKLHDVGHHLEAQRYHLALPGGSSLASSTTLAQNGIGDGAVLVLSRSSAAAPGPRYDDTTDAISAALDAATHPCHHRTTRLPGAIAAICLTSIGALALIRDTFGATAFRHGDTTTAGVAALAGFVALLLAAITHRAYREPIAAFALSAIATVFAAVAGFMTVPGVPGVPNVLLATMAAAVTSVLAMRASGAGVAPLTAVACCAMVIVVTALVGVITAAPPRALGSVSALVSLALLGLAARAAILLAGLSPRLPSNTDNFVPTGASLAAKAIRADGWLTGLLAAFSSAAAAGAVVTVLAGAPRLCCSAFGAMTGALLLLRSRSGDRTRMLAFVVTGFGTTAITFGVTALRMPEHATWVAAATALLASGALYLGFVAPGMSLSPLLCRSVELLESMVLVAMVPLTCWICGLYGAIRGLTIR